MPLRIFYILWVFCFAIHSYGIAQPGDSAIKKNNSQESRSLKSGDDLSRYGFQSLFSNEQYNTRFPFNHKIHPEAWGFIQDYLEKNQKNLSQMKSWALPYFTLIENIMSQYNLPKELKYLAVIESGLTTHALSWAGARGPWQLMPETAKQFGLEVNKWNDERTDYFRSTHAAAKFLKILYSDFQDWLLVIAAYNSGPGRVWSAIKKSGSKNFWQLQHYLPDESRLHVKKFIATNYVMEDKEGPGISVNEKSYSNDMLEKDSLGTNIVAQDIAGKFSSAVMCKQLQLDLSYFNLLNPDFDPILSENKIYTLRLPRDKMEAFNNLRYSILSESVQILLRFYNNEQLDNSYPKLSELPEPKKKKTNKKNN